MLAVVTSGAGGMALALRLGEHKTVPERLMLAATVTLDEVGGVPAIVSSQRVSARAPGLDAADSEAVAGEASDLCPVSRLFATPLFVGFANEIMPLQIGAPDVAFLRLNILSYYFFAFGGLILLATFLTPGGAPGFGWYAYSPLTSAVNSPGVGGDMWIMGLVLSGLGTILSGVNFVTTIVCMRAPGMTMFRMPIFTWNVLVTSIMVLLAFPVLAAALLVLEIDAVQHRVSGHLPVRRADRGDPGLTAAGFRGQRHPRTWRFGERVTRSEEHTSEL